MPTREQMHSLTQGIINSYDARAGAVRRIRKDTHFQLGRLGKARGAMARQQQATLASGRADLARDVRIRLSDTHAAHQTMARQQQATLTSGRADLARDVRTRLTDAHAAHQAMAQQQRSIRARGRSELQRHGASLLSRLGSERQGAHNEWQRMATTLSKRRGGATSLVARPGPTATAPPSRAEPAEDESGEEIVARAEAGESPNSSPR